MADPQTADQGFLAGLLGKFGADPAAAYGGLLSDPATQRQFALRSLGAAAQAMAQASMPVPYKGGMPWGSFLGSAGGAAATAGDALMHARLEQAQQQQALANVGLSQQQVTLMQAALPGLKSLISTGQDRLSGGAGTSGTGTDGKPLTGPAKILAGNAAQGGGIGAGQLYGFLRSFDYPGVAPATPQEASFLTGNAKIESNFNPDAEHDGAFLAKKGLPPGYGMWGDNADRLAAMRKDSWVGPTDNVPWQQQAIWQLQELRKSGQGAAVNAAKSPQDLANLSIDYLRPDTKQNDGFRAERRDAINTYLTNPPDAQTASTGDQPPAAAPGSQVGPYAPVPGQPPPQGVYVPPGASPNAPPVKIEGGPPAPAAPPGGLLKLPDPTSAAPPQLATPPAAGAPGSVTGLLGQQPAQQVAAADAPQLSPAAAAILQGITRQQAGGGLPPGGAVAGPGAPSEPPAVAPADAVMGQEGGGIPGLLQQPPPAGATPTATPYTSAPPVTGQGAPAPGPAPTGPPIAPPLNLPPIPTQMPTMPNLPAVQPTPQQQIAQGVAGLMALSGHPAPPWIDDLAKMPAQMAMEQYKAWVGGQANMMTEQYKKQIEVAAAGTISYLQSQGQLPADLTKMTNEQNLKLRNSMAEKGLEQKPDGSWGFMPGYIESEGIKAKQAQDAIAAREAQTPQKLGPTDMLMLPPGSPAAQAYRDAQTKNQKLPAGVTMMPDGSVQIQSLAPTSEQITANTTDLMKLKDQAQEARQGMYETQQLRQQLHSIGMSGPATEIYAGMGAWAQSLGILNQDQVKKYIGLNPASSEVADKMSQDLLGEVLKTTFPGRITNADVTLWKNTVPRGTQLQGAYDLLIDKILMPKFEQTVGRYGSVAQLPANDPQLRTYTQTLETYDKAHPVQSFVQTFAYAPDGSRMRLDKSDPSKPTWVPDAANPRAP